MSQEVEAHGLGLTSSASRGEYYSGFKITIDTSDITLQKITKHNSCTAATAFLLNSTHNTILAQSSFSGNDAVFNYILDASTVYYVLVKSSSYTMQYGGGGQLPVSGTYLNWSSGIDEETNGWTDLTGPYSIVSLTISTSGTTSTTTSSTTTTSSSTSSTLSTTSSTSSTLSTISTLSTTSSTSSTSSTLSTSSTVTTTSSTSSTLSTSSTSSTLSTTSSTSSTLSTLSTTTSTTTSTTSSTTTTSTSTSTTSSSSSTSTSSSTSSTTSSTSSTLSTTSSTSSTVSTTTVPPTTNKRVAEVRIDGVNVTSFCTEWERVETYGDTIPSITLTFTQNITSLVTLGTDLTLEVWEYFTASGYFKIWNGFIESFKPEGAKIKVIGRNNLADVIRKEITHVYDKNVVGDPAYPDGKISDIALDIITTYCGLTADGTTVQDSGTTITLSKFICNHADPLERLKKLQEVLGWVLYYRDDTDKVYFEPKGYTTNTTTLTVGTNIIGIPKWTESKDQMINDLTLEGAVINEPRSELKSGNGVLLTFQLTTTEIPNHFEVYYGNTTNYSSTAPTQSEQKVGVPEGTTIGTYDYTFDLKNRSITCTSFTPSNNANNVLIKFWIETPSPIHRTNDTSIATYGRYKKTITLSDVMNVDDAENRCTKILEKFSAPFDTGKFEVLVSDSTWKVGQFVNVVDNVNSPVIDEDFVIIKIIKRWSGNIDEFTVGDKQWLPEEWQVNILERLKRLEESLVVDATVVNEIKDNQVEFGIVPDYQTLTNERINDTFTLGVDPYDIVYDDNEAFVISDFEDITKWLTSGVITLAKATANTTLGTTGDYLTGTGAVQFSSTEGGGWGIKNTSSLGDFRTALAMTGLTGTPTQGTFGVWLRATQTSNFTATIQLNIGQDESNYCTYNSQTYAQKIAVDTTTWSLDNTGSSATPWTLLLFDADVPTSVTGVPAWSSVAYAELKGTVSGATVFGTDYFTLSKSDVISLCGIGERYTAAKYLTVTY